MKFAHGNAFQGGMDAGQVKATGLRLALLGQPQITLNGQPVTDFATSKGQALLFYLALADGPRSRETLADLLWPEMPDNGAKRNLTKALSDLPPALAPYLIIERQSVAFNRDMAYWLDVEELEREGKADREDEAMVEAGRQTQPSIASLSSLVSLYRGDFLEGLYVRNAQPFEEWLLMERERLRERLIQVLERLVEASLNGGADDLAQGLTYARRWVSLDPWCEKAHRQIMLLLAKSGDRAGALAQYEVCRRSLAEELDVEPAEETVALYDRLKGADTPLAHNLPYQANAFVGREAELRLLLDRLAQPDCRLLTLIGPGGMGKTRLALQVGQYLVHSAAVLEGLHFTDGVYFVNLAGIETQQMATPEAKDEGDVSDLLATAIGEALDLTFRGASRPMAQVVRHLRDQNLLLILDNLEQALGGVALVRELLRTAPHVKLLVTSRVRLNLTEEWSVDLGGLEQAGAYDLFVARARQANRDFTPTDANRAVIDRICALVEGTPLALELAASWLRILSLEEVVVELERGLDFLATTTRDMPERHRSLRAVFDHSWERLDEGERETFASLSLFRGGFTRQAARAIVGAGLPTLSNLADKSLVRRLPTGRFDIHELLRQYATEKFWDLVSPVAASESEMGDPGQVLWERYSAWYLSQVAQAEAGLASASAPTTLADLRLDLENIRRAWRWAVNEMHVGPLEASITGLTRFYELTGLFEEGATMLRQAADHLKTHLAQGGDSRGGVAIRRTLVLLQARAARLLLRREQGEVSLTLAQDAAELAAMLKLPALMAVAQHQWGEALMNVGQPAAAQTHLDQALRLAQKHRLARVEAEALRDLGILTFYRGNYAAAEDYFRRGQACFQALGDLRNEAILRMNLGSVAYVQGDFKAARACYNESLAQFRTLGDRWGQGMLLNNLACTAYEEGQYSEAEGYAHQCFLVGQDVHEVQSIGHYAHTLGRIQRDMGNFVGAEAQFEQSAAAFHEVGHRQGEALTLTDWALLEHYRGDHGQAHALCQQAIELAQQSEASQVLALALTFQGHIELALGRPHEALAAYQKALAMRHTLGDARRVLEPQAGVIEAYLALGQTAQARAMAHTMLTQLAPHDLAGLAEPFRILLAVYHGLDASADPRAQTALELAHDRLLAWADRIQDATLRRSFLTHIPAHREIMRLRQALPQAA